MAELNTLEEKLAEVLGLAQAAQGATEKVETLVDDDEVASTLKRMRQEAEELSAVARTWPTSETARRPRCSRRHRRPSPRLRR